MHPTQIMRRAERTAVGLSCIAGGCLALVGLLANSSQLRRWTELLENRAAAAEETVSTKETVSAEAELAPQPRVKIPAGRPDWVEADYTHEQRDVKRVAVSSGPFNRKQDARRELDKELARATSQYVADYLGNEAAGTLVPVDVDTIRRELVHGQVYEEEIEIADLGPMYQTHALVEFTPSFKQQLEERWRSILVAGRVAKVGVVGLGLLMALSVVFGYFKADNATRGYYTTRLQVGTAGAILALVAGGFMLFRYL
jgi:hypothetical protein